MPFMISYPQRIKPGGMTDQFAYVTDFLPTVLDIAGIPMPGDDYRGKKLIRPTGTSMLPYLEGKGIFDSSRRFHARLRGDWGQRAIFRRLQDQPQRCPLPGPQMAPLQPQVGSDRVGEPQRREA